MYGTKSDWPEQMECASLPEKIVDYPNFFGRKYFFFQEATFHINFKSKLLLLQNWGSERILM
jgi:hypothetical protein